MSACAHLLSWRKVGFPGRELRSSKARSRRWRALSTAQDEEGVVANAAVVAVVAVVALGSHVAYDVVVQEGHTALGVSVCGAKT